MVVPCPEKKNKQKQTRTQMSRNAKTFQQIKNTKRTINSHTLSNSAPNEWMKKTKKAFCWTISFVFSFFLFLFFFTENRHTEVSEMNNLQIIQWIDRDKNRRLNQIGWLFVCSLLYTVCAVFVFADGSVFLQPIFFHSTSLLVFPSPLFRIYLSFFYTFFLPSCKALISLAYCHQIYRASERENATGNRLLFLITKTAKHIYLLW